MPKKSKIEEKEKITEKKEGSSKVEKKESKRKKPSEKDFEKEVLKLADEGLTAEKIGEKLRQQEIHPKEYGKKISKILKENNKYVNPDLKNIEEKLEKVKTHFEKNKQDKRAQREKDRIFAQLRKTKKYHKVA